MDLNNKITRKIDNLKVSDYPLNYEINGTINEDESFRIFIHQNVIEEIDSYLISDLLIECGGVFLGNVFNTESNKLFIIIDNFIIARSTKSTVSRLTFTHDTWEEINHELEMYHTDKIIVGWFHSHPGHGVFLSGYDIFIQENFFNEEFMIAYVYDPVNNDRAFFQWNRYQIAKSNGYNVIKKNFNPSLNLSESIIKTSNENRFEKKIVFRKYPIFILFLLIVNVIILILLIIDNDKMKTQIQDLETESSQQNNLKTSIDKLELKVNDLILKQLNKEDSIRRSNNLK